MSASISLSSVFRFLILALFVAGMLVKPVLAAECEINDALFASSGTQAVSTDASGSHEDCCSLPDCNDCCAHSMALQPAFAGATAGSMRASVLPSLSVDFEPIAFPVAFRPPIAA